MSKSSEFLSSFENIRGEIKEKKKKKTTTVRHDSYTQKIKDGREDEITLQDLRYFFIDTANEAGIKYVTPNIPAEYKVYKMLLERGYTQKEIMVMIEFIFLSDQDYLEKGRTTPRVLLSNWCNTIYYDSQKWLNGEYHPRKKKAEKKIKWETPEKTEVKIGEWDDE